MTTAKEWVDSHDDETPVARGGKRCGVKWAPVLGDWFTSWSPRNGNNNAEGPWDHWVDIALAILSDPLTGLVRPDEYQPEMRDRMRGFYDETGMDLTDDDLRARFEETA